MKHLVILAMAFHLTAQAEPTRVTRWLMNEPMSMFDWGIYSTEKKMAELKITDSIFTVKYFTSSALYDWDADRIRLRITFTGKGTDAECTENLKRAKGAFLNFNWNEKEQPRVAREVLASLFSHQGGYKSKDLPNDIGEQLANTATFEATVYVQGEGGSYIPKAKCNTSFTSSEISISRQ